MRMNVSVYWLQCQVEFDKMYRDMFAGSKALAAKCDRYQSAKSAEIVPEMLLVYKEDYFHV
jgi:hypothetical protein